MGGAAEPAAGTLTETGALLLLLVMVVVATALVSPLRCSRTAPEALQVLVRIDVVVEEV